jgi:hypothetical protein
MTSTDVYQPMRAFLYQSYIMFFCLTFFIMSNPILVVVLHLLDTEYQLCESFEEEDSEEKEKIEDSKEKDHKLYCSQYIELDYSLQIEVLNIKTSKYLDICRRVREFNLEVPIPPPKNC